MIWGYAPDLIAQTEKPLVAQADREQGADALMRRAAYALAHHTHRALSGAEADITVSSVPRGRRRILVLVGAGNNGGDGLYGAAYLRRRGYPVAVLPTSKHIHERGAAAARQAGVEFWPSVLPETVGEALHALQAWKPVAIIDAIIGIGARPPLREPALSLVRGISELLSQWPEGSVPLVVACDHPSGLDLYRGADLGPNQELLSADLTVTMGAAKTGMLVGPGALTIGRLQVQDIGLPQQTMQPGVGLIERADVRELWPWPHFADHKYSRGVLGVMAGSARYPGAGVLVTSAALNAGESFVRYLGEPAVQPVVLQACPEVVLGEGRCQARIIGPGFTAGSPRHREQMLDAWRHRDPGELVILDAGALGLIGTEIQPDANCLLTPHAGETAALAAQLGQETTRETIGANPYDWALQLAADTHATVLVKGPTTTIANPGGQVYSLTHGTPDLATAGSGDVLAGILGYVFAAANARAQKTGETLDLGKLAAVAAWLHAEAGRLAAPTPRATAIVKAIPQALAGL